MLNQQLPPKLGQW